MKDKTIWLVTFGHEDIPPPLVVHETQKKASKHLESLLKIYQKNEPWENWKGEIIALKTDQTLKRQMYIDLALTSLSHQKTTTHPTRIIVIPVKKKK